MATPKRPFQAGARVMAVGIVLPALWASIAFGQPPDLKPLLAKVDPAIVSISTDGGSGWGVVVDAAKGLVATNYHLLRYATEATVAFSAAENVEKYPVEGLMATMPGKDLALIRIKSRRQETPRLKSHGQLAGQGSGGVRRRAAGFQGHPLQRDRGRGMHGKGSRKVDRKDGRCGLLHGIGPRPQRRLDSSGGGDFAGQGRRPAGQLRRRACRADHLPL